MSTYTPAEKALAALWWNYDEQPDFEEWLTHWMPAHLQHLRNVLEVDHLRVGQRTDQPESIATGLYNRRETGNSRLRRAHENVFAQDPADTSRLVDEILTVLPTAYQADGEWRGFSYMSFGFRDWHLTSHTATLGPIYRQAQALLARGVLDWFYGVEAHGQHDHIHALLSFRHGHPQEWLKSTFNLPDDTKLAPTHGSFARAQEYLDNQATRVFELGSKPNRAIYVDGNRVELRRWEALEAISQGEPTYLLQVPPLNRELKRDESRALNMWMQKSQAQPRVEERVRVNNSEAWDKAWEYARAYTNRIFEADFKQTIGGSLFLARPQGWFGQEVVLFRNIPQQNLIQQLSVDWLKAVPVVVYTVDTNPNFKATVVQVPDNAKPPPPLIPIESINLDKAMSSKGASNAIYLNREQRERADLGWWRKLQEQMRSTKEATEEPPQEQPPQAQEATDEVEEIEDFEGNIQEYEETYDPRRDERETRDPDREESFI